MTGFCWKRRKKKKKKINIYIFRPLRFRSHIQSHPNKYATGCIPAGLRCRAIQTAALRYDGPNGGVRPGSSPLSYMCSAAAASLLGDVGERNLRWRPNQRIGPGSQRGGPSALNVHCKYTWGGAWSRSYIIISLSCHQDLATSRRILCSLSIPTQNLIRDKMKRSLTCHSAPLGAIIIFLAARLD